jgi:tRNA(Ser,Leu) C12 N-acetylase TAN1
MKLHGNARTCPNSRRLRPRRTARLKPTGRTARRKRGAKKDVLTAETVEQLLAGPDGLTTAALAKQAGAEHDQVLALLRHLESAQRVRRTGQRRATRWHAVTDEDRIRERAAELANRQTRRAT